MEHTAPLTLSYESFSRIWKALVSKRKARKLNVDQNEAWTQLRADGESAKFLLGRAARKAAKTSKAQSSGKAGTSPTAPKPKKRAAKRAATSKSPAKRPTKRATAKRTRATAA